MAVKAGDANVDRFLTKPYNGHDLMAVVREAMRVRSTRVG
jgi:DNA-binding response OmpR family regulator